MAKGRKTGGRDWKPGQSGHAGYKLPEDIKAFRKLSRIEFEKLLSEFLFMNKSEVIQIATNPESNTLKILLASIISKAIKEGDHKRMDFLLDRLIGTVAQTVRHTGGDGGPITFKEYMQDLEREVTHSAQSVIPLVKSDVERES